MLKLGWDLVWTIINLIVLYLLMKKFLIGPVMGIMEKRKALIASQFDHAKAVQEKADELKGQYEQALSSAKEESAQIIEGAKADAKRMGEGIVKNANLQAAKIIETAKNTAEQEKKMPCRVQSQKSQAWLWSSKEIAFRMAAVTRETIMLYDEFLAKAGDANDTDLH